MLDAVVAFFVYIVESFTGSVLENSSIPTCGHENDRNNSRSIQEIEPLVQDTQQEIPLDDFTKFEPTDTVFQEFDPPPGSSGKMAWKDSRPSRGQSFVTCFKTVFLMQFLFGSGIAFLAIAVVVVDVNTADLCYEKTSTWNSMPHIIQSIRVTSQSVEGFFIQLWHFFIMLCMFGCSVMKELNLLTINLLAAFMDSCYRLSLQIFGIYKRPWMSYPLNVLFCAMVLANSLIIAKKHIIPVQLYSRKKLVKIASLLALQFLMGIPATFVLVYKIFPWYSEKSEIEKVLIAGACPLIISVPKVVVRAAAPKFDLVHPGILYLLVGCLYASAAIVFRVMQAELTSFSLFVALGVGHAVIDFVERLTVTMRDHIWEYMYKLLSHCNRSQTRSFHAGNARTPRSMRFVADVSIQLLLTEATALVTAVGFIQVDKFMYPDNSRISVSHLIWEFILRCVTGLAVDIVFNTVSVWLQVTIFNVAILKVWNSRKWRAHVIANILFTVMSVLYFTEYLFIVVRAKNDHHTAKRFAFNCSLPFSSN